MNDRLRITHTFNSCIREKEHWLNSSSSNTKNCWKTILFNKSINSMNRRIYAGHLDRPMQIAWQINMAEQLKTLLGIENNCARQFHGIWAAPWKFMLIVSLIIHTHCVYRERAESWNEMHAHHQMANAASHKMHRPYFYSNRLFFQLCTQSMAAGNYSNVIQNEEEGNTRKNEHGHRFRCNESERNGCRTKTHTQTPLRHLRKVCQTNARLMHYYYYYYYQ